jgi:hypothetical protein
MVVGGGDFSIGFRFGALDARGAAAEADSGSHHHFPYARRLRLAWRQGSDGHWTSDREDDRRWEVFCAECGDTDGPSETQSAFVQHLRGPYSSKHKAKHAATRHFEEN